MRSTCDQALALGDDALIAAQRLIEWVARAPEIEEDVALANIALDLLGRSRMLLTHAGSQLDPPRTEDELAYTRDAAAFRNSVLVERENGDFAVTMVRLLFVSARHHEQYTALLDASDPVLAAIAAKAMPEIRYHRDHARLWVLRLGDGTAESHRRASEAVSAEWPYFVALAGSAARDWVAAVLAEATLAPGGGTSAVPAVDEHTADLTALLEEFQVVARAHPGATW